SGAKADKSFMTHPNMGNFCPFAAPWCPANASGCENHGSRRENATARTPTRAKAIPEHAGSANAPTPKNDVNIKVKLLSFFSRPRTQNAR
ncbi:MAG: hypothetical protein ACAI38_12570, partial [Myxococcota bacterium]